VPLDDLGVGVKVGCGSPPSNSPQPSNYGSAVGVVNLAHMPKGVGELCALWTRGDFKLNGSWHEKICLVIIYVISETYFILFNLVLPEDVRIPGPFATLC